MVELGHTQYGPTLLIPSSVAMPPKKPSDHQIKPQHHERHGQKPRENRPETIRVPMRVLSRSQNNPDNRQNDPGIKPTYANADRHHHHEGEDGSDPRRQGSFRHRSDDQRKKTQKRQPGKKSLHQEHIRCRKQAPIHRFGLAQNGHFACLSNLSVRPGKIKPVLRFASLGLAYDTTIGAKARAYVKKKELASDLLMPAHKMLRTRNIGSPFSKTG